MLKARGFSYLHPKRTASHFLLSGIARCGNCGKSLVGHDARGGKFSYYVCGTLLKKGSGSCPARYVNGQELERAVVTNIKQHILTRENLERLVCLVNEETDSLSEECREQLETIERNITDINHRLERLYDILETRKVSLEDLMPRIQQHKYQLEKLHSTKAELEMKLNQRRIELADVETVTTYVEDLHNLLSESSLAERKSFIRSFVKEVKVKGKEVELTYTIPMPPSGVAGEKIPVLSIVQYGGRLWIRTTDPGLIRTVL